MTNDKLAAAIHGQYDIKPFAIIAEAWKKTKGVKASFWGGTALNILVCMVFVSLLFSILVSAGDKAIIHGHLMGIKITSQLLWFIPFLIIFIGSFFVILPMFSGMLMIGIYRVIDHPHKATLVFKYFRYRYQLFMAFVVYQIIVGGLTVLGNYLANLSNTQALAGNHDLSIGLMIASICCFLVYLYFFVSYLLYVPLIVEKKLLGWRALRTSRQAIYYHWFKIFALQVLMFIILVLSVIPFAIGLIWSIPMLNNAFAILYREIFGIENLANQTYATS